MRTPDRIKSSHARGYDLFGLPEVSNHDPGISSEITRRSRGKNESFYEVVPGVFTIAVEIRYLLLENTVSA